MLIALCLTEIKTNPTENVDKTAVFCNGRIVTTADAAITGVSVCRV